MVITQLQVLQSEVNSCTKCTLHQTKDKYVFAKGNPLAKLLICAEAPGAEEDKQGIPLVGRAGQCLDRAVKSLGIDPENDIYYVNILKCRPPNNRAPTPTEVSNCISYLHQQIDIVKPKVILALGNTAVKTLLDDQKIKITAVRGSQYDYKGSVLIPGYHPSYILRTGGVNSEHFDDFLRCIKYSFELSQQVPAPIV